MRCGDRGIATVTVSHGGVLTESRDFCLGTGRDGEPIIHQPTTLRDYVGDFVVAAAIDGLDCTIEVTVAR